jgi:cobaltochelatase CobS
VEPATYEDVALDDIDVPLRRVMGPKRPGVPSIDPCYHFRPEMVRELQWAVWPHDDRWWTPSLLVGPKGCGKTSLVMQIAAYCNIPVFRINLNVGTTTRHLKGRVGAESGSTVFVPGVATMAMEQGGWLLLDEISGATPPVSLSLFPILEPDGEVLLEDAQPPRYVERHPDFRVFATDNTIGAAQEETRFSYGGTNPEVNEALLDRFGSTIQVDYMEAEVEHATITKMVPGADKEVLEGMIRVADNVRKSEDIGTAFSMRMVVEWIRRHTAGMSHHNHANSPWPDEDQAVLDCAYPAFLNKMRSKVEQDAISEVIRRCFALGRD